MPARKWTFADVDSGKYVDALTLGAKELGSAFTNCSVAKQRLAGGTQDGVDLVQLDNGYLRIDILPTRGMGIWRVGPSEAANGKPAVELGWRSPVRQPVHPSLVPLHAGDGIGWLDGFNEMLVRCGLESNGAPEWGEDGRLAYPLHGKIANQPARQFEAEADNDAAQLRVSGTVDEARLFFNKLRLNSTIQTKPGSAQFTIVDEVTNTSAHPGELQLLYHVNFGLPLLDPGSRVVLPAKQVVPRNARAAAGIATWDSYANETPGFEEQVYFFELSADEKGQTQTLLRNAHGTQGVSLHFDVRQLPCYTLWKSTQAAEDGYVTGLEPGTNFPNPRSYEGRHDRVVKLEPGESRRFELTIEMHPDQASVAAAESAVAKLLGATKVFETPQKSWSPDGDA